jgi:GTP-binding protein SAR1
MSSWWRDAFDRFWQSISRTLALFGVGPGGRARRILLLGLDNAGKTTLLGVLAHNHVRQHAPTQRPHADTFSVRGARFDAHDLGGHAQVRRLWREYCAEVDGVVFVVDLHDAARFGEARDELRALCAAGDALPASVPLLIVANKCDLFAGNEHALVHNESVLRALLGVDYACAAASAQSVVGARRCAMHMCSVRRREGVADAFAWLASVL